MDGFYNGDSLRMAKLNSQLAQQRVEAEREAAAVERLYQWRRSHPAPKPPRTGKGRIVARVDKLWELDGVPLGQGDTLKAWLDGRYRKVTITGIDTRNSTPRYYCRDDDGKVFALGLGARAKWLPQPEEPAPVDNSYHLRVDKSGWCILRGAKLFRRVDSESEGIMLLERLSLLDELQKADE